MTEAAIRLKVVEIAQSYVGARQGSTKHKKLIDTYNTQKVLPSGYRMTYSVAWCAASVTAWSILAGTYDIIPAECSCGRMITKAKEMGIWEEKDSYVPKIGDFVMYDWDDTGNGDCVGAPEHVGIVSSVTSSNFTVIEGNKGSPSAVGTRTLKINGRYIRGFICPKYSKLATTIASTANLTAISASLPVLKKGVVHQSVKLLQAYLNACGYSCGECDGSFGPNTESQFKAWQKAEGLTVDGSCGKASWSRIING